MGNNSFLSIESPLYKFMSRLTDIIKLNFLWLLCSIPVVTMGASTVAAFSITLKMVEDEEGYVARKFFHEFKENLKKGSVIGIIQCIAMYAIYLDFQLAGAVEGSSTMFTVIGVIASFLAFMHLIYAYALLARYENTIINTMRNSHSICIRYFKKTIGLFLVLVLEFVVFLWNFSTLFLAILIGPACVIYTISGFARPLFRIIETDNEERAAQSQDDDEEENNDNSPEVVPGDEEH